MSLPRRHLPDGAAGLAAAFADLRDELDVPAEFPPEVLAAAERAAATGPRRAERVDARDVPFVTIDPPGARDLDQAVHIGRTTGGWRVRYAIADVAAFVSWGDAIDAEARSRGLTLYSPDQRTPLHPPVLSEGAASLLPGQDRAAVLWDVTVGEDGLPSSFGVRRAVVRSRAQLDYAGVQQQLDAGTADDVLVALRDVGRALEADEAARGGVSVTLPEQEVVSDHQGGWQLAYRTPLPVEGWNAQVSLLTGRLAADLMLDAGVGVLRRVEALDRGDIAVLRRTAKALGVPWPRSVPYEQLVRTVDLATPAGAAFMTAAGRRRRGAGYVAFDGDRPARHEVVHGSIAAPYAHATAPLRRLVDRGVAEVCLATADGGAVPDDVRVAVTAMPAAMDAAGRRASALEHGVIDLLEAVTLAGSVGERFTAAVVDVDDRGLTVQLGDPPVRARASGDADAGDEVAVELVEADPTRRRVRFRIV